MGTQTLPAPAMVEHVVLTPSPTLSSMTSFIESPLSLYSTATQKSCVGPGVGLAPQRHYIALGIPTCWYLKMLKFAFPLTQNPNASQWNIGCVGSQLALGLCVGHVHFIFFVLISFALGSRRKRSFQWNMGFKLVESWWNMVCRVLWAYQNS